MFEKRRGRLGVTRGRRWRRRRAGGEGGKAYLSHSQIAPLDRGGLQLHDETDRYLLSDFEGPLSFITGREERQIRKEGDAEGDTERGELRPSEWGGASTNFCRIANWAVSRSAERGHAKKNAQKKKGKKGRKLAVLLENKRKREGGGTGCSVFMQMTKLLLVPLDGVALRREGSARLHGRSA